MKRYISLRGEGVRIQGTTERLALLALVEVGTLSPTQLARLLWVSRDRASTVLRTLTERGDAEPVPGCEPRGRGRRVAYTTRRRAAGVSCGECVGVREGIGPLRFPEDGSGFGRCSCGGIADYVVLADR